MTYANNDHNIISLIAEENIKGLELLYHKYFALASKAAFYILKDETVAEDLAQDVFLKLWKKKNSISNIQNIKSYILTASKNLALDHIEKSKNLTKRHEEYIDLKYKDIYHDYEDDEREATLKKTIMNYVNELPPKCRLIFSLNRFEGLTNDEISEHLDISKRTVETQISNALKSLRKKMAENKEFYLTSFSAVATFAFMIIKFL